VEFECISQQKTALQRVPKGGFYLNLSKNNRMLENLNIYREMKNKTDLYH
jgi:hypothetical protein